jgi:hypothetical protein
MRVIGPWTLLVTILLYDYDLVAAYCQEIDESKSFKSMIEVQEHFSHNWDFVNKTHQCFTLLNLNLYSKTEEDLFR